MALNQNPQGQRDRRENDDADQRRDNQRQAQAGLKAGQQPNRPGEGGQQPNRPGQGQGGGQQQPGKNRPEKNPDQNEPRNPR